MFSATLLRSMLKDAGSGALGALSSYARGDLGGVFKSVTSLGSRIMNGDKATNMTKATRSSNADVISISGCRDNLPSILLLLYHMPRAKNGYFPLEAETRNRRC
jgi:hypothetical protein